MIPKQVVNLIFFLKSYQQSSMAIIFVGQAASARIAAGRRIGAGTIKCR